MRHSLRWGALLLVLLVVLLAGIALGPVRVPLDAVFRALGGDASGEGGAIVSALRMPRVALAALSGAALAMAGGALQGTLRNGLAEPYLLGVSGGAAVGGVLAWALGATGGGLLQLAAFSGALLAVILVLLVARAVGGRADPRLLILAGVVVGTFANAVILVALARVDAESQRGALWWMMGSVAGAEWRQVAWLGGALALGGGVLLAIAREVDVLALGEDAAAALGVDADRASRRVFIASSLVAGATVASAGLIGFVGLVVPHLARGLGFRGHRAVVGAGALVGAALLVLADLVARIAVAPTELPLGAVTALVGVPFLLARLRSLA